MSAVTNAIRKKNDPKQVECHIRYYELNISK